MLFSNLIDKTKHRKILPSITAVGKLAVGTRFIIPPIFVVVLVIAAVLSGKCPYCYSFTDLTTTKQNESQIAYQKIKNTFGTSNMVAVIIPSGDYRSEGALLNTLEGYPEVKSATGLANTEAMDGYMLTSALNPREFSELAGIEYELSKLLYSAYAVNDDQYGQFLNGLDQYEVPLFDMFLFMKEQMEEGNITLKGDIQDSLDELEDAALELVSGSGALSDGATSLADGVNSYTEGADELNDAIQMYLGKNGTLSGSVTEYVDGVNKVAKGVQDYTDGANELADGVTSYVTGEQQLAAGADQLTELGSGLQMVQSAIQKLSLATDGEGDSAEDIKAAAKELAAGTAALKEALGTKEVQMLLGTVDSMVKTGNEMIDATGQMESELKEGVAAPVQNIAVTLQQMQSRLATINQQLAGLQRECQKEADSLNQKINAYNQTVNQAKKAAADSKSQMNASIQTLQEQLNRTTDETARAELEASIQALQKAQNAADGINQLSTMEKASIEIPTIDTTAFQGWLVSLSENMKTFSDTAENLKVQLAEMGERLSEIQKVKESLPSDSIQELTTKIDMLDGGMQRLNAAIGGEGGLSESLASLNAATVEQFPKAISGIHALNDGFETLGEYNASLLEGAAKLKAGSESLVTGIGTLQSGTNQLASGLNTLGTQMSAGSAKLISNSEALRSGASELQSGAAELAEGMRKFDREGTSKLKNTVEEELGDILDRLDALMSDDCAYQTFSGKDSSMDGNVKFVIETEAIE